MPWKVAQASSIRSLLVTNKAGTTPAKTIFSGRQINYGQHNAIFSLSPSETPRVLASRIRSINVIQNMSAKSIVPLKVDKSCGATQK